MPEPPIPSSEDPASAHFATTVLVAVVTFAWKWLCRPFLALLPRWVEGFTQSAFPALALFGLGVTSAQERETSEPLAWISRYIVITSMIEINDHLFHKSEWLGRDDAIRCRDRLEKVVNELSFGELTDDTVTWTTGKLDELELKKQINVYWYQVEMLDPGTVRHPGGL